jgi:DNA replication protein DnaC
MARTRDDGLGHLEFLQALCEDEMARRESAALTRRLRRAKFEVQATFEDFDFTANPRLPGAMLRDAIRHCGGSTPANQSSSTARSE